MDKLSRLSADQRSNLVAYLDGELADDVTSEIESVLAHSGVARNDVEMLARTYDLLDELPRFKASQDFTARTMTTIRMEDIRPDITETVWYQRMRRGVILGCCTLAMMAASTLGFMLTRDYVSEDADVLVKDYEVIHDLDVLRQVDDVEFLRQLDSNPELLEHMRSETDR